MYIAIRSFMTQHIGNQILYKFSIVPGCILSGPCWLKEALTGEGLRELIKGLIKIQNQND